MDTGVKNQRFCITDLPEEHLYLIFEKLDANLDQQSFGLTCHRFLHIQNSGCKSLDLGTLTRENWQSSTVDIDSFKIDKLLKRFTELVSLALSGCIDVTDSGLTRLQHCGSKLHTLYLDDLFNVTNKGISFIASGCPLLTVISLSQSNISDRGLKNLSKSCKYLKEVDLAACDKITDSGIRALNQNCRQLRTLSIFMCHKIVGVSFQGCSPTLACLKADHCVFSSAGVNEILSGGGLEYLSLAFMKCIEGNALAAIGLGFAANLKVLDFYKCDFVTDDVILSISKGCPLLQEWDLSYCGHISTSGYEPIGLYCKNLVRIHLNRCYSFHYEALLALGNGCERLKVIHMKGCPQASYGIQDLKTQRTDLRIIEVESRRGVPRWVFAR